MNKKINKAFTRKKASKEDDTLDSNSSSSSVAYNSRDEKEKSSITYDSELADDDESSNISIVSKGNIWLNGCRNWFIINKVKPNSKSKINVHTLSFNNLDKALNDAHL